jgi:hypothetical protein
MALTEFSNEKIGIFLSREVVYVPQYQRGYSWEEAQVDDFWQDLLVLFNDPSMKQHFLGQVVFHRDLNENKVYIIDGQQRITTSVILFDALRTVLQKYSEISMDAKYYGEDITSLQIGRIYADRNEQKLVLGEINKNFFYENIQKEGEINYKLLRDKKNKISKSNMNILNASEYFINAIYKFIENEETAKQKANKLVALTKVFKENFYLLKIETTEINEAYVIFETLNARGKDLETSDLLKNHVLRTAERDMEEANEKWNKIIDTLGESDPTQFIRYFWNSRNALAREKDLYRELRNSIKTPTQVMELLKALGELSEVFISIVSPDDNSFFDSEEINECFIDLKRLKAASYIPIIFALYSKEYKESEILQVAKSIEKLMFRNFLISSKNANKYEAEFANIAKSISDRRLISVEEVIDKITEITIDDEEFYNNFIIFSKTNKKSIRYIFEKIINYTSSETKVLSSSKKIHLEHILPQKHSTSAWKHFTAEEAKEYVWKLGNLTLLGQEYNQKASNKSFEKKKEMYSKSNIQLNRDLVNYEEWTKENIDSRQKELAKLALEVWNIHGDK